MLLLHLFCRKANFPYDVNWYIKDTPVIYYIGLWGDQCVALYCFCAGYASYLQQERLIEKRNEYIKNTSVRIKKLLINYWIIVILFSLTGILIGKAHVIPGSIIEFIGNISLLKLSYNGAWWFMFIYMLLAILSPWLYQIVKGCKNFVIPIIFGGIYFVAYLVRFEMIVVPDSGTLVNWIISQGALLGTSMFPYVLGMIFYKLKIITKIRNKVNISGRKLYCCTLIIFSMCIILHGIEESLIIAPFFALITICTLSLWDIKDLKFLRYMGEHSTNIWLVHMFFYLTLFEDFIFVFKHPITIYVVMVLLCLATSYVVRFIVVRVESLLHYCNLSKKMQ